MTQACYLVGYPVGHSLSAVMHNAAFREMGLDLRYELRPVRPEALGAFAASALRASGIRGANVTIPHKVPILRYLDEVEAVARCIGAVNTIVNDGGRLKGYNTDGPAAMRALEEAYGDLLGVKVVIVGAGGAARAIAHHLSAVAGELVILNRTPSRASNLAESLVRHSECSAAVSASGLGRESLREALEDADILINATPLGMSPNTGRTPVDGGLLRPGLLVFDTVYNPLKTRLLREAEAAGAGTLPGVRMLVYQGAAAFRLWTGREPPEELMMRAVLEALGGGLA